MAVKSREARLQHRAKLGLGPREAGIDALGLDPLELRDAFGIQPVAVHGQKHSPMIVPNAGDRAIEFAVVFPADQFLQGGRGRRGLPVRLQFVQGLYAFPAAEVGDGDIARDRAGVGFPVADTAAMGALRDGQGDFLLQLLLFMLGEAVFCPQETRGGFQERAKLVVHSSHSCIRDRFRGEIRPRRRLHQ